MVRVLGSVLVVSMLFFSCVAVFAICVSVKVVGGVYRIGMLAAVHDLTVIYSGRLPVALYMVSMREYR